MQNHPAYINNDLFNVLMLPPNEGFGVLLRSLVN